ncbi:uncharacterized protein [Musca autumnalis]|uniref:uncharacterized protein n=1 Tax=Musca autumnalis TaxID=221902 RepID=UPI003CF2A07E
MQYLQKHLCLGLLILSLYPLESQSFIEDLQDILDVTYHFGEYIFGNEGDTHIDFNTNDPLEIPILRDKQKKVLNQIKTVTRDIDDMVDKQSHYNIAFRESTMNAFITTSQSLMLFMRIEHIKHRIDSMYRHMKRFERNLQTLESASLLYMAQWFVDPNTESVEHLLNLLHLELFGRHDDYRKSPSGLELLAKYYGVSKR